MGLFSLCPTKLVLLAQSALFENDGHLHKIALLHAQHVHLDAEGIVEALEPARGVGFLHSALDGVPRLEFRSEKIRQAQLDEGVEEGQGR